MHQKHQVRHFPALQTRTPITVKVFISKMTALMLCNTFCLDKPPKNNMTPLTYSVLVLIVLWTLFSSQQQWLIAEYLLPIHHYIQHTHIGDPLPKQQEQQPPKWVKTIEIWQMEYAAWVSTPLTSEEYQVLQQWRQSESAAPFTFQLTNKNALWLYRKPQCAF